MNQMNGHMVNGNRQICLMTVDVEDWFHDENLRGAIRRSDWDALEFRVRESTRKILDSLDRHGAKATFFILGWVAERVPELVREISSGGHEVASHGYGHELAYRLEPGVFRADLRKSKKILEDIVGAPVVGYRAPCFSITDWAIDVLREEGFRYDSSFFPTKLNSRYGRLSLNGNGQGVPILKLQDGFYEVTVSTLNSLGVALPWGGAGYFRFLPYGVFSGGVKRILKRSGVFLFYVHPWELDSDQPRITGVSWPYRFRHYVGIKQMQGKFDRLVGTHTFLSIKRGIELIHGECL